MAAVDENVVLLAAGRGGPTERSAALANMRGLGVRKTSASNSVGQPPAKLQKMDDTSSQPTAVVRPRNAPVSKECAVFTEDFVDDINDYLFHAEDNHCIEESFLNNKKVTAKMRSVLVDWMVQVHQRLHLHPETLHLAVYIVDRFVERVDVDTTDLQLMGVCAMLIAAKYEETDDYCPLLLDFQQISNGVIDKKQMIRMEEKMVQKIGFPFGRPHSIHFLESLCKKVAATPSIHSLAKYLSEMCLLDASFSSIKTSLIAASSLWLAYRIKAGSNLNLDETLAAAIDVDFLSELKNTGKMIARSVLHVRKVDKQQAVTQKYSVPKMHKASCLSEKEVEFLEKMIV